MKRGLFAFTLFLCGVFALGWAVQATSKPFVSGNAIERNGTRYVPLKAVASALKLSLGNISRVKVSER